MTGETESATQNVSGVPRRLKANTDFERFEEATKRLFQVSKKDVDKAELRAKKERAAREAEQSK